MLAGERDCERPPGFDLGNSPQDMLTPLGPELILATTNGAPAIVGAVATCDEVLLACLLNEDAVVRELAARTGDILILCAGTNGNVTVEDTYLAGRLSAALDGPKTDAALIAEAVAAAYPEPIDALEVSAGAQAAADRRARVRRDVLRAGIDHRRRAEGRPHHGGDRRTRSGTHKRLAM